MRTRLFSDADNTLWDADAVYASAQLRLGRQVAALAPNASLLPAERVAALALVRTHDQRIAAEHEDGLRYPPLLLAEALHVAFGGDGDLTRLADAIDTYQVGLCARPALRAGVYEALPALASAFGHLTVVTETSETRCLNLLEHHGLASYVDRIVCGKKAPSLYRHIRDVHSTDVMVGDQLDRDIAFAQEAGFRAILFAGTFAPFWSFHLDVRPDSSIADFRDLLPLLSVEPVGA